MRLGIAQGSHLADAGRSHGCHVNRCRHGAEGLVGTDVGGCLFPSYMLLPCLKRQHIRPPSVHILCLAHNTSGKLTHHVMGTSHQSQIRAAECQGHTQGLAFTGDHISAALPWRFKGGARNGVYAHHKFGACGMYRLTNGSRILNLSEIAGLLDEHA